MSRTIVIITGKKNITNVTPNVDKNNSSSIENKQQVFEEHLREFYSKGFNGARDDFFLR